MLSTTKARPNYYEMLGLSPTASSSDIASAFARAVSTYRPRPFGSSAGLSIAYATLRDPAKRRAYDASIGLRPEPEPKTPDLTRVELKYQRQWAPAPFMAGAAVEPVQPDPAAPPPSPPPPPPSIKEQVEAILARRSDPDFAPEPFLSRWTSPGLTIMALLLAAAMIGAFAGLKSVETIEPEQPARAATVRLDPPAPEPARAAETPTARPPRLAPAPDARVQASKAPKPVRARQQAEELDALSADSITESIQVLRASPADELAEAASPREAAAAALPIANKDIARTIQRIGYACGAVDSAVPVEGGGQGVFKITCRSGDTYRASPIRGRYHFRRWDRR